MPLIPLDRESEPYSKYGNIAADGIQRLLGAPNLDALQILIRETVQNSWDAGQDVSGPVGYRLRFRQLSASEHEALRDIVFNDLPKYTENPERPIKKTLASKKLSVVEICDFGTSGLGGPTHPDEVPKVNESPDFVDFLRNIGSPRDTVFGGGTYGYGKSCLYAISQCQTIVVDSATTNAGKYTRRFMACRIASRYDISKGAERGRYTGRHWWGRRTADGHLDPVTGKEADTLSRKLGMIPRDPDTLGTSIMIIAPDLEEDDLRVAAQNAVRILLWYCWPKVVAPIGKTHPPMEFDVEVNGEKILVPHPSECPPLNLLTNSLQQVREQSDDAIAVRSLRPKKHLGYLHVTRDLKMERLSGFSGDDDLYPDYSSHVALMRPAELVVKYLVGDRLPSENAEWGGVFMCSDEKEVEQAFAAAEPPAHDDWDPRSLPKGRKKTYVRVALQRVRKKIAEVTGTLAASPDDGGERGSLGIVADALGSLLGAAEGQRLGTRERKKGNKSKPRKVSLSRPQFAGHKTVDDRSCALFELAASSTEPVEIRIDGEARIARDGGGADRTDSRGHSASIVAWQTEKSGNGEGPSMNLSLDGEEKLVAIVEIPDGKAVAFNVSFEELK
jgi:hypothetical protein